jgi:hypothetical protein
MLKTVSSVANALGALNYKGTWNAATNTPTLASGVGTQGDYYVVSVDGTTDLDGITNWGVGDWAAFNGSVWQRVEGGADGNFVQLTVSGNADVEGDVTAGNQAFLKTVISEYSMEVGGQYGKMVGTKTGSGVGGLEFYSYSGGLYKTADLTNSGNLNLTTGNLIVSSGAGIDFSATAGPNPPASGTSELLDDYEEGDWTPAFANIGTGTYTHQVGRYTKVGNLVTASVHISINVLGTASGSVDITNLPFTASAVSTNYGSASSIHAQNFTTAAEGLNVLINPSTAVANVYSGAGTTSAAVSVTHAVMGTGNFLCTLVYFTA